jgi:hypothetical protein
MMSGSCASVVNLLFVKYGVESIGYEYIFYICGVCGAVALIINHYFLDEKLDVERLDRYGKIVWT